MIEALLNNPIVMAFGWTLVHSLWLALSLALLVRIGQHFISADRAVVRYRIGLTAMISLLLGSTVIFLHYFQVYQALAAALAIPETAEATVTTIMEFDALGTPEAPVSAGFTMEYFIQQMESYFPFLVVAWLTGALLMGLRLAGSWMYLNNLGKKGIQNPTDEWNLLFRDLCTKMGIQRPVQFFISDRVQEPITLRHLKPIVLFPIGLVTQLSIEQVEVVLLHELAHIKRWDYLVNWMQSLLELLFFYHPAVWWLSGQVRTAREHCCDDLVLQAGNQQKMLYAQTLTQVSAYSLNFKSKLAMSLSGKNNNSFTFRVKRLFGQVDQRFDWQKSMISGLLVLFVALVALFNASSLLAGDTEPLDTELWDLINDEVAHMELEDEFILESIIETDPDPSDNPKREPMIMINRKFVGYGDAGKAKLDPNKKYEVYEFMAEWAMLDFGERARWGAINYVTPTAQIEKEALVEGAKNLFGLKSIDLVAQDTTPLYILDGVQMKKGESINDLDPENIASVTVLKDKSATALYGSGAKNGVVIITTKNAVGKTKTADKPTVVVTGRATEEGISKRPLIVVDGVKKGFGKEKISKLDPKDIATVNVFKGEAALKKYGEDGRNGVVVVVTKANAKEVEQLNLKDQPEGVGSYIKIREKSSDAEDMNPLIVINGKVVDKLKSKNFKELDVNPNDIKSMKVLKGDAATGIYGPTGKDGVLLIDLKKGKSFEMPEEKKSEQLKIKGAVGKDPLYVVNMEIVTDESNPMEELTPDQIKSVNVLKGKSAMTKYQERGKNGVVEIITKDFKGEVPQKVETTPSKITIRPNGDDTELKPYYVVDGKGLDAKEDPLTKLDPNDIATINVLKGESALTKYPEKGANGVIEIYTKDHSNKEATAIFKVENLSVEGEVKDNRLDNYMVFINGERQGYMKDVKNRLDKKNVKSFTIYGENQLPARYKDEKQPIILIKTKKGDDGLKDDLTLKVNFKGKVKVEDVNFVGNVKVEDAKNIKGSYEVEKMSLEMKDLKEADTKAATSHMKFSSEDGIDIKAYLTDGANHPLLFLDNIQMKTGDSRIKNLDPASVKSIELIEAGPALIPYGDAAKYGIMKISTKPIVVAGKKVEPQMENGMDIGDELKDSKFWFGPKGNTRKVDPLVVVDGNAKGLHSKVSKNYSKDDIATVIFSGPTSELSKQFGRRAKDGVVFVDTKKMSAEPKTEAKVAAIPSFQREMEASLKVFPNPFGKETRINFNLPQAARTKVSVFNAQGQLVKVLQDAQLQAGLHQVDWNSERSPSGNYNIVIESLNTRISKTIIKQ